MNKTSKKFTLGLLIIMCIGLMVGCYENKNFVVGYDNLGSFGSKEGLDGETRFTLEMVDSLQSLKDLCDDWGNQAFLENSEIYTSELSQKLRSYNEVFFNDNHLIIYSFERGHQKETKIDSIEVDGSILTVNTRLVTKKGTFTDEAFDWLILIEVDKAYVKDSTTIQVKR